MEATLLYTERAGRVHNEEAIVDTYETGVDGVAIFLTYVVQTYFPVGD